MIGRTATTQEADGGTEFRILSDSPALGPDDPLDFDGLARQLERTIVASHGSAPFTVSIEAGWGAGKSTLMRRLEARLTRSPDDADRTPPIEIETVWFNAWTAPESGVLEGLVRSVLDKLDTSIIRKAVRKKRLMRGLGVVASIGASLLGLGTLVDRVWQKMSVDPKQRNELNDFVQEAMARWLAKRTLPENGLIVVFIDDLDRCSADVVMEVFEAIKLYLDAPGLVFVLGWDTEQVIRAVAEKKGDADRLPQRYVEKIVQFGYRIRKPSDDELADLLDLFCRTARISSDVLGEEQRRLLIRTAGGNPRQMKRFLNRFTLLYQITRRDGSGGDDPSGQVEARTLIHLLVLQASYDGFYRALVHAEDDVDAGDRANPLFAFSDYEAARRASATGDWDQVERIAERYGMSLSGTPGPDWFAAFERDRPSGFLELAGDGQFIDQLGLMSDDDKRQVWALARSADLQGLGPVDPDSLVESAVTFDSGVAAPGATVLWVDDDPKRADHSVLPDGVDLHVVTSGEEAIRVLTARKNVDLVISDIGRGDRPDAGLDDLRDIRSRQIYDGPVVFYTTSPTAGQVDDARQLGADTTSSPRQLQQLVRRYVPVMPDLPPVTQSKMSSLS